MPLQIAISNRIDDLARNGSSGNVHGMLYENSIVMLFETGIEMDYEHT